MAVSCLKFECFPGADMWLNIVLSNRKTQVSTSEQNWKYQVVTSKVDRCAVRKRNDTDMMYDMTYDMT